MIYSVMISTPLIPAKAGIQKQKKGNKRRLSLSGKSWIPASAGMSGDWILLDIIAILTSSAVA